MTDQTPSGLRPTVEPGLDLTGQTLERMRSRLPSVAAQTVAAIMAEVPSYAGALSGPIGQNIQNAVQLALGGFIVLASGRGGPDPLTPAAPALQGAYQLGRGEARSGRSMEALLAAYRIGARVSWREMSASAVEGGTDAATVARFAELVFAYIDELSAASAAGHTDELATTGRVRQRILERLGRALLVGEPAETVRQSAEQAGWVEPETLTAALVPEARARPVLMAVDDAALRFTEETPGREGWVVVLVPDAHGRARTALVGTVAEAAGVVGPARPWTAVAGSYARAVRAQELGLPGSDTEEHLVDLVLRADPEARADLRSRVLAPLAGLGPAKADKLAETLRSWLLNHGRRDAVAAELFVHPQTVRYRVQQLREVFGDALNDPRAVLELTIALA